jgi:hypothetical protein
MALTNKLWAVLAAAGCVLIWLALLFRFDASGGPKTDVDDPLAGWRPPKPSPLAIAERRVAAANDRLRLLEIRDSLVRLAGGRGAFFVTVDSRLPAETHDRIAKLIQQHWGALAISGARPVVVAVVIDSAVKPHGLPIPDRYAYAVPINTFIPSANTNGSCVSVLRLRFNPAFNSQPNRQFRATLSSTETIDALLSPCAFFAAFGEPGPQVRDWLLGSQISVGKFAEWNEASGPWKPALDTPGYGLNIAEVMALASDPTWRLRKYVAPQGIGCLAGEPRLCATTVLQTGRATDDSSWSANVVTSSGTSLRSFYLPQHPTPLGPSDGWILSEMVRTLGRDRFEKFWTSALPVAEAFHQASGEDIQDWTRRWAVRTYGPAQVGPSMSNLGLGTGLVIVLLGLGGATPRPPFRFGDSQRADTGASVTTNEPGVCSE